jgi:hypothetical protein
LVETRIIARPEIAEGAEITGKALALTRRNRVNESIFAGENLLRRKTRYVQLLPASKNTSAKRESPWLPFLRGYRQRVFSVFSTSSVLSERR